MKNLLTERTIAPAPPVSRSASSNPPPRAITGEGTPSTWRDPDQRIPAFWAFFLGFAVPYAIALVALSPFVWLWLMVVMGPVYMLVYGFIRMGLATIMTRSLWKHLMNWALIGPPLGLMVADWWTAMLMTGVFSLCAPLSYGIETWFLHRQKLVLSGGNPS